MHTLYDADHFRIALGQLSTAKHLIESISRDYVRLLKYAQSLFQCKQLKRAALGRMATIIKRLNNPLKYLDEVRQHLGRLPSIDPNTRTLVICGYPNVGKSSFLRSISRADVDVQPYAFTTKSLFAGHFDYKYLRFQAVDTPGVLDHPLEEMTTIEMQSITAIAHLRAAILYFMDLSEQCGYSVKAQCALFKSIKPLFANKICFIVVNKIDVTRPEDLDAETQAELQDLLKSGEVEMVQASCNTQEGVQAVKNAACEKLIAERVASKLKAGQTSSGAAGSRLTEIMTRIHVAQPMEGSKPLETFIPEGVKDLKKYDKNDPERRQLARDIEEQNGGAGVFSVDLRKDYLLKNPEWKYDKMPEVVDGKNVFDFIDPDIDAKLAALEEEEERLQNEGYYDSEEDMDDDEEEEILEKAQLIREKQALIRNEARMRKSLKNRAIIPRSKTKKPLSQLADHLDQLGIDATEVEARGRAMAPDSRGRSLTRSRAGTEVSDAMEVDKTPRERLRSKSRARSQAPATDRLHDGIVDETARTKAERTAKVAQRKMNRMARQGEADRHTPASLPKHLVSQYTPTRFTSTPFRIPRPDANCLDSLLVSVVWARLSAVKRRAREKAEGSIPRMEGVRGKKTLKKYMRGFHMENGVWRRYARVSFARLPCHSCAGVDDNSMRQPHAARLNELNLSQAYATYICLCLLHDSFHYARNSCEAHGNMTLL